MGRQALRDRQFHVWIPRSNNAVSPGLEVNRAFFLSRMLRLALKAQTGPEFTERQAEFDISL